MKRWRQILGWVAAVLAGLALIGLGAYFVVIGLDRADQLASVVGVFVGLVGLALSAYGVMHTRRTRLQVSGSGGQTVDRLHAGQGVDVVDTVAGSVRFGTSSLPSAGPPATSPPLPPTGEQKVTNARADGNIRVIRGVGGDVDIGR